MVSGSVQLLKNVLSVLLNNLLCFLQLDAETEFEKRAREGMNDDEAQFSVELALDKQAFLWSDKYRPRKPRFFNRVHTVSRQ